MRVKQRLFRMAQRAIGWAGYSVTRSEDLERRSIIGVIKAAKARGFQPVTVIDVGAAFGDWTREVRKLFPSATVVLVEPLEEFHPFLEEIKGESEGVSLVKAAASRSVSSVDLHVHQDLFGASLLSEVQPLDVRTRRVSGLTLDQIWNESGSKAPCLLKIDVQGAELEVLEGAEATIKEASMIVVEASLFEFFTGGPLLHDVVEWFAKRGFMIYDIADLLYRPIDGALAQVDVVFVPYESPLRSNKAYAMPEQQVGNEHAFTALYQQRMRQLMGRSQGRA